MGGAGRAAGPGRAADGPGRAGAGAGAQPGRAGPARSRPPAAALASNPVRRAARECVLHSTHTSVSDSRGNGRRPLAISCVSGRPGAM